MRTLLLADDSITVQRVIALTFAGEPIQVVSVGDGQQAIEKMAAMRPDIVLAGTTLPTVNGYELAKFMRSKNELRSVPVLLLAGAFEDVDDARLAASGASGLIEKPVEPINVIGRVKELLGLKSNDKPATPVGRMITSAGADGPKKLPIATPPRAVTNTHGKPTKAEPLRSQSAEPNAKSVEDSSTPSSDYLDTLDSAFDTLDQQLSGRVATTQPRNPSGPLQQSSGATDPRSPGRPPSGAPVATGNPIFEVDDEWFGDSGSRARADAKAGRRELAEDLHEAGLQLPAAMPASNPIFEVDDEWFKENEQARAAKLEEHRRLAAEMGIDEVDLPDRDPAVIVSAPTMAEQTQELAAPRQLEPAAIADPVTLAEPPLMATSPIISQPAPAAPAPVEPSRDVVDVFADLVAFEQPAPNARPVELSAPPPEIRVVAPEITDAMLDQIASRVAPPQITDAMLDHVASRVAPPQITDAMLDHVASRVAPPQITDAMLDHVASRVAPPQITDAMLDQIASRVAPPQITDAMLGHVASRVAPPQITDAMLDHIVSRVAPPQITDAMLDHIASRVAPPVITAEMLGQIAAGVAPPEINEQMLDQIASRVADRLNASAFGEQLREQISSALRDTVRSVVSETAERLVRDEIDRIRNKR